MVNEGVVTTIREAVQELADDLRQSEAKVAFYRREVEQGQATLRKVQEQKDCAVHEDEQITARLTELLAHYNIQLEKPLWLRDKITRLQAEQSKTHKKREEAEDIVRHYQETLREAQTRLAVAQESHKTVHGQWVDASQHLQQQVNEP